ncbi:hypothetical protein ACETK8_14390 [Brevundimonas staleyi]|uniref:Uncharacterized protein n=1 Tax=Brevundimonas staleyi TaxID=74326 RepID=A0ABW0FW22_9CAUL
MTPHRKPRLVQVGQARRLTRADMVLGMYEQVPISRYEMAGWQH